MPHPIRSTALRTLAAGGLLGGIGLLAPATTQAQVISPERGLLNYTATTAGLPGYAGWASSFSHAVSVGSLEGARALLGAPAVGYEASPDPRPSAAASKPPVDGDRALRNAFPEE